MTAIEEMHTQVDNGRHTLSELAWNVIEKVPDVVDATLEEIHRDGPLSFGQAHEFVEHVVAGAQDRMTVHNPTDSHKRSVGHAWRRGAAFLIFGFGVGVLVYRRRRAQRRPDISVTATTTGSETAPHSTSPASRSDGPYHTSTADPGSQGGVYHDQESCPAGQRIKPEHRVSGTDGRSLCKDCQSLAS
jgi:hypothetical protein